MKELSRVGDATATVVDRGPTGGRSIFHYSRDEHGLGPAASGMRTAGHYSDMNKYEGSKPLMRKGLQQQELVGASRGGSVARDSRDAPRESSSAGCLRAADDCAVVWKCQSIDRSVPATATAVYRGETEGGAASRHSRGAKRWSGCLTCAASEYSGVDQSGGERINPRMRGPNCMLREGQRRLGVEVGRLHPMPSDFGGFGVVK